MKLRIGIAVVLAGALAALVVPTASANYVYWPNLGGTTIGRVAIDGTQLNNDFIKTSNNPMSDAPAAVAVDSHYIYWVHGGLTNGAIGRAKLDGTDVNPSFIPHSAGVSDPFGITVTATHIYWANEGPGTIGRVDISGANPNSAFISDPGNSPCGLATDNKFLYYTAYPGGDGAVARVPISGGAPEDNFVSVPGGKDDCGVAVDTSHIYFNGSTSNVIERANIDGTNVDPNFISGVVASGIAVTPQYVFWGGGFSDHAVGRAAIDGSGTNQAFAIPGDTDAASPYLLVASPSNQLTLGKPKLKKNGTAKITATVSGPGVVVADAASKGVQAVASKKKRVSPVRRAQKTASGAATLTLKIRANGKALKSLKRKGKAKVKVGITFTPQGVAGVPATTNLKLVLKRR
jgi:hypothetical protein